MKKALKIIGIASVLLLILTSLTVIAFADSGEAESAVYKLYKDGEFVKEGYTPEDFMADVDAATGVTRIELVADLDLGGNRMVIDGTVGNTTKLELDLAGKRMLFSGKLNTIPILVAENATVDIFSSKPGANLACTNPNGNGGYNGDPLLSVSKSTSLINLGEFTEEDGTVYSGDNLTVTAISLLSTSGPAGARINIVGGTYIRVPTSDQRAFIMQRNGASEIYIKGAHILANSGAMFLMSADEASVLIEDSVIAGYGSPMPSLVNTGMTVSSKNNFFGEMTFKNSTVLVTISAPEHEGDDPDNYTHSGTLKILGANAFESTALTMEALGGMSGADNCISARISRTYAERNMNPSSSYIVLNPQTNEYHSVSVKINAVNQFSTVVTADQTAKCIISNGVVSFTETWYTGIDVIPDLRIMTEDVKGVFKATWSYTEKNGVRTYKPKYTPDFQIKVSYSYDGGVKTNVYIPAVFYEEYMDELYSSFGGKALNASRFIEANLGGEKYYRVSFDGVGDVEVKLVGNIDEKNSFEFKANVSLACYATTILDEEISDSTRTAVYDLCNSAITMLAQSEGSEALIEALLTVVEEKQLTSGRTDIYEKLVAAPETDSSYMAQLQFGISYDVWGNLRITIPQGFEGKLDIISGDYKNSYSILKGKADGQSEITLFRSFNQIYDGLQIRVYDSEQKLLSESGNRDSATYSLAEAYSKMSEGDAAQLKANLALYYSLGKL